MKYEKFDILKKAKYSIVPNNRELYVVYVECDANDGDYMRDTIEFDKESFEEDELLLLVLSYVSKYSGRFSEKGWNSAGYGHHVDENKDFPWLSEYLSENDILIFAGMCDIMCHSVSQIRIEYYDNDGRKNKVELPDVDNLFENKQEFVDYLNSLYKLYYDEQLRNTFYHELFHVFQFYYNNEFNEIQAQVYANFMCEFIETTEEPF